MLISVITGPKIFNLLKVLFFLIIFLFTFAQARDWTIMVYMCADNGLDDSYDLAEMMAVGSSGQVQIIVQTDNLPSHSPSTTCRYKVEKDSLILITDLGEKDMADITVATDFVKYCRSSYPANNYCLILWDHGSGWYPTPSRIERSIIYDYTNHDSISVANGEFKQLFADIKKALGKKLNLLVIDGCMMGQIEVASEVSNNVEIFVASEALVPLDGLPYTETFQPLISNPSLKPKEFARAIVEAYANSYNSGSPDPIPATLTAIDLTRLASFNHDLAELLDYVKISATDSIFVSGRNAVQTFPEDNIRQPRPTDDYIDLYDFLSKTKSIAPGRYNSVLQGFDSLVLANRSIGAYYPQAKGLAAWFPDNYLRFKERAPAYQNLVFADTTGWHEFLNQYYHSDDVKPAMTNVRITKAGSRNNFTVNWDAVYDLAGVTYQLTEIADDSLMLFDQTNDTANWFAKDFSLSTTNSFSPPYSFYSGSLNNLDGRLVLKEPLTLDQGGLFSFYAYFITEENIQDGKFKRDICYIEVTDDTTWQPIDSLYGFSNFWNEYRYLLDSSYSNCRVRFHFITDSSTYIIDGGIYIDDIKITRFGHNRTIVTDYPDSSFNIFNVPKDIYKYLVMPKDGFGNKGMVSQFCSITIERYAEPYAKPNPFFTETGCSIYCDYPPDEEPKVYIYTLAGELVRKFEFGSIIDHEVYWDGKNWKGKEVGSGIYLVGVKSKKFSRLGKIAKVK